MIALMLGQPVLAQDTTSAARRPSQNPEAIRTETPIKHIIYLVPENRSFDNIYATYKPKNGQKIMNLLSQGIVNDDGTPGPNFAKGQQFQATATNGHYSLTPLKKAPYKFLPVPTVAGARSQAIGLQEGIVKTDGSPTAAFPNGDPEIPKRDQIQLATGGYAPIPDNSPDTRIVGAARLPPGPFQQTGPTLPYDSYEGDTSHDFFPMWQQSDCSMQQATRDNPTGCIHDLYPFVDVTNGTLPSQMVTDGGQQMAYYNMEIGDAPVFKKLADDYAISDNFHQSINGGSVNGAIAITFGDNVFFSDGNGNAIASPQQFVANPDPVKGTINTYQVSGAFANCSDRSQPGVPAILDYLASLPYHVDPNCAPNTFYEVTNVSPGFLENGKLAGGNTMPPIAQRHIGDELRAKNIPWVWYSGGWNASVAVANGSTDMVDQIVAAGYSNITNPFQYAKSVMADATTRTTHLKDVTTDLFSDIANGTLPPVAFVKSDVATHGHPGTGKVSLLEDFIVDLVGRVKANPKLWANTVIVIGPDESGGMYDSGFIQPLDFFGDGPRLPLNVISPYAKPGYVSHVYLDQASVLKFIERNWHLGKITNRSRDNLPNPVMDRENPWVPTNMPAIGDLFDMFDFSKQANNDQNGNDQHNGDGRHNGDNGRSGHAGGDGPKGN